jgi:AraC-like DNA-binding protein
MSRPFSAHLFSSQVEEARYYSPQSGSGRVALHVVCAGRELCRSDYQTRRRNFPWWAVELVMGGEAQVEVGGAKIPLKTGSLFCYGPGVAYTMTNRGSRPLLKYFVDFTGTEARKAVRSGPLKPGEVRQALYPQELQEILDRILIEGNRQSPGSTTIVSSYLRIFLQKLEECAEGPPARGTSRSLESYLKARSHLEQHHLRLASVEEMAAELGTSPETLCRTFHRFSPMSPYQTLLQLKMNVAVDLLLGSHLLIKEVGQRVGFEDAFHFSRLFKRIKGVPPETFRQMRGRTAA